MADKIKIRRGFGFYGTVLANVSVLDDFESKTINRNLEGWDAGGNVMLSMTINIGSDGSVRSFGTSLDGTKGLTPGGAASVQAGAKFGGKARISNQTAELSAAAVGISGT